MWGGAGGRAPGDQNYQTLACFFKNFGKPF